MSNSLYWRPVPKEQEPYNIGYLKQILRRHYFDDSEQGIIKLGSSDLPYLGGLRDGTLDKSVEHDVNNLIGAIEQHGEVEIFFSS